MNKNLITALVILILGFTAVFSFKTLAFEKSSSSSAVTPDYLAQTSGDNLADSSAARDKSGSSPAATESSPALPSDGSENDLKRAGFGNGPKQLNIAMVPSLWQDFSDPDKGTAKNFLNSSYITANIQSMPAVKVQIPGLKNLPLARIQNHSAFF
jgi:hypothetical protein